MVKLVSVSGKDFCKILEKLGFEKVYGKGSHVRFNIPMEEEQSFLFMGTKI